MMEYAPVGVCSRALADFVRVMASFGAGFGGLRPAHRLRGAGLAHYPLDLSRASGTRRGADFAGPPSSETAKSI
jgi:hypothetical protein